MMRRCGLPVPEIEYTHLDDPEPSEPFIVMPKFSEDTLTRPCAVDADAAVSACEASGGFTHELHDRFYGSFRQLLSLEDVRGQLTAVQEGLDRGPDLGRIKERFPELVDALGPRLGTPVTGSTARLIHGQTCTPRIS